MANLKYQMLSSIDNSFTPGVSKHALKNDSSGEDGSRIFSFRAMHSLKDTASDFSKYMKANYPEIKKVCDIKGEHVTRFLESKQSTCSDKTIKQYQTRLSKIGLCCSNHFGTSTDFKGEVPHRESADDKVRTIKMEREDYEKVLSVGKDCESKTAIKMSSAFGLRVSEAISIKVKDIGSSTLFIERSKGGRNRTLEIRTEEQKEAIKEYKNIIREKNLLSDDKVVTVKANSVNRFLNTTLKKIGIEKYNEHKTGVHSIRKMYATERYVELKEKGMNHKEAWGIVSEELGHGRDRDDLFKTYVIE